MGRRRKSWYSQLFSDLLTHRRRKRKMDRSERRRETRWKLDEEDRERRQRAREERASSAERQTDEIRVRIAELEGLLGKRRKDWRSLQAQLAEVYRSTSPERFAKLMADVLAIEGRELKYLLKRHCDIDCLISLPKLPPGWRREDVSQSC